MRVWRNEGDMNEVLLKEMMELPEHCIYALVCDYNKRFMVGHTRHLLTALSRIVTNLETPKYTLLREDMKTVKVKILETNLSKDIDRKIKVYEYVQKYLDEGYQQYIPSNLVKYTLHSEVSQVKNLITYFVVYLQDKSKNKIIVGLFRSTDERDAFLNKYYPDNKVTGIFYSTNSYTKKYMKRYGIVMNE